MSQIDGWYDEGSASPYTYVGCNRNDCRIFAKAYSFDGPWKLPDDFAGLLDNSTPDPDFVIPNVSRSRTKRSLKKYRKDVWAKTKGQCYYCGIALNDETFSIDHLIPESKGGATELQNLVPVCRSCNSTKGTRSIEELRFLRRMEKFKAQSGVRFDKTQLEYLNSIGVSLTIPEHRFWFENNKA